MAEETAGTSLGLTFTIHYRERRGRRKRRKEGAEITPAYAHRAQMKRKGGENCAESPEQGSFPLVERADVSETKENYGD